MKFDLARLCVRYQPWIIGFFIILLASGLRLYRLGSVPAGLSWDEAAIGYNGFAIATQHRDEWLQKMPLVFKSFGEYKPPIAIYSVAVTSLLFGPTAFAIRLPMALAGILTVLASFAIAKVLLRSTSTALFVMALVAVSPLNIQFSRIAFESSIGVAFTTIGAVFFLWAKEYSGKKRTLFYLFAGIMWALTFHTNHATKIVLPFVILGLLWQERKVLINNFKVVMISLCIAVAGTIPLIMQAHQGIGTDRLAMTSIIFNDHGIKPIVELVPIVFSQTMAHFDPRFLFLGHADNIRHGNEAYGIFSFLEGILVLVGSCLILFKKTLRNKYGWLLFICVTALIPAVISTSVPHPNRVHHLVPWIQIVAGIGLLELLNWADDSKKKIIWGLAGSLLVLQLIWQLPQYYHIYGVTAATEFQYGYAEAVQYAQLYEPEVDELYFTDAYKQPYIYVLLYQKILPISYNHGALIKYRFTSIKWDELKDRKKILVIGTPDEIPDTVIPTHTVFFPNGDPAFVIMKM